MKSFQLAVAGVAAFALPVGLPHATHLAAQGPAPAAGAPTFEVASVKPNKSGEPFIRFRNQPGGRFNAENVPLRELIRFAYGVQNFQIEGGPSWINSDRFDIVAKAEGEVAPTPPGGPPGPIQMMMRALLAERFNFKVHNETKEMPIYALVLARADGKLGPKIEVSKVDCAALVAARRGGGPQQFPPALKPGERPPCGIFMGLGSLAAGNVSMLQLAQVLSPQLNRIVVDKTGLTGNYGFNLEFTPDQLPPAGGPGPALPPGAPPLPPVDPNGPSIFTAIQEQLGLKLESTRGPVEILVIDSVEQPTPD